MAHLHALRGGHSPSFLLISPNVMSAFSPAEQTAVRKNRLRNARKVWDRKFEEEHTFERAALLRGEDEVCALRTWELQAGLGLLPRSLARLLSRLLVVLFIFLGSSVVAWVGRCGYGLELAGHRNLLWLHRCLLCLFNLGGCRSRCRISCRRILCGLLVAGLVL